MLLGLLNNFEDPFDGTIGKFETDPVNIGKNFTPIH